MIEVETVLAALRQHVDAKFEDRKDGSYRFYTKDWQVLIESEAFHKRDHTKEILFGLQQPPYPEDRI